MNDGATWTPPALLNGNAASDSGIDIQADLETDGAGTWLAVWRSTEPLGGSGTDPDILVARSVDGGLSWSAPALLASNAATDSGADSVPRAATDGAGNWVVVWSSDDSLGGTLGTDEDILIVKSTDGAITWSAPAALDLAAATDAGADTRPQLVTDRLGTWVAAWNSTDSRGGTLGTDQDLLYAVGSGPDRDGDGLSDGAEVNLHATDPLDPDSDGDGLLDGAEVDLHGTDPTDPDTDGDGHPLAAVEDGAARERGEVAPGPGLAVALAPDEVAAQRGRDEAAALLLAAAGEERRCEERRSLEQDVAGRAGAPVLLTEDRVRERVGGLLGASVGLGELAVHVAALDPALAEQRLLLGHRQLGLRARERPAAQELAQLGAQSLVLLPVLQVQALPPRQRGLSWAPSPARGHRQRLPVRRDREHGLRIGRRRLDHRDVAVRLGGLEDGDPIALEVRPAGGRGERRATRHRLRRVGGQVLGRRPHGRGRKRSAGRRTTREKRGEQDGEGSAHRRHLALGRGRAQSSWKHAASPTFERPGKRKELGA